MDVQIKQTNTTEASATLAHDDIVSLLGLAVKMKAGIASDQSGASVTVKLLPVDGSDQFTAQVDVLVDHNAGPDAAAVAPAAGTVIASSDAPAQPSGIIIPMA